MNHIPLNFLFKYLELSFGLLGVYYRMIIKRGSLLRHSWKGMYLYVHMHVNVQQPSQSYILTAPSFLPPSKVTKTTPVNILYIFFFVKRSPLEYHSIMRTFNSTITTLPRNARYIFQKTTCDYQATDVIITCVYRFKRWPRQSTVWLTSTRY